MITTVTITPMIAGMDSMRAAHCGLHSNLSQMC
jgi:hypothetical protein